MDVRNVAVWLTQPLRQKDFEGEARALFRFVRDDIRYVRDIRGVETLHRPQDMLKIQAGDCDDKATLLAALIEAIGGRTRFIAVAMVPGQFCHVWVQAWLNGRWVDLETTEPLQFGQRIPASGIVQTIYQEV